MQRLTPLWMFIIIFAACAIYLPGLSKYLTLKRKDKQLEFDIARLEAQIKAIKTEEAMLKNDIGHLEKVIRQELGLVKPGEIIYKVIQEEVTPLPTTNSTAS